jgi:hypothetical protein
MIKCGECGYENMDGLDYCDGCGAKLAPAATNEAEPVAPPPDAPLAAASTASVAAEGSLTHTAAVETAAESTHAADSAPVTEAPAADSAASRAPTGEIKAPAPQAASHPAAPAAPAPFKAKLSVMRGGRRGQEFELETGNNLIGRWDPDTGSFPEVDLDADDPEAKVSRKHALIRIDGGKITVEDIGSLNGTYVNRQPRLQPGTPSEIKDGDEVIIGKTFLKLTVSPIS